MKKNIFKILLIVTVIFLTAGCTSKGKIYTPNLDSVDKLQSKDLKQVKVSHNTGGSVVYEISLGRGTNMMSSPYITYQEYLEKALTENLMQAGLYSEKSNIRIKATLLNNELDTGLSTGTAILSANFVILEGDVERLNKTLQVKYEWESHFVGAIAMSRTIDNYVIAMQKLVDEFLLNDEVLTILKN